MTWYPMSGIGKSEKIRGEEEQNVEKERNIGVKNEWPLVVPLEKQIIFVKVPE
jgi:hypothetical protein